MLNIHALLQQTTKISSARKTGETGISYDEPWLDSTGDQMPFIPQATFMEGDIIDVESVITAHHMGHVEVRACPITASNPIPTQACFNQHKLEFISDEDGEFRMPQDESYRQRGYLTGSTGAYGSQNRYFMKFKLPDGLIGETVLLQWWYFTANSCSPVGYDDYFNGNNQRLETLPGSFWNEGLGECGFEYTEFQSEQYFRGGSPERFVNCAEIRITSNDGNPMSNPTNAPTTSPPTAAPISMSVPTTSEPVNSVPTSPPVNDAHPSNIFSGAGCCSRDFKTCDQYSTFCISNKENCLSSTCTGMTWLENGAIDGTCKVKFEQCFDDTECCNGLTCQGTEWWRSCKE